MAQDQKWSWAILFAGDAMKLTAKQRGKLPAKAFALKGGRYPIENESHARNALARVSQHGTPQEKATVRRKVQSKYPAIAVKRGAPKRAG